MYIPKYADKEIKDIKDIPINEWEQLAAFDTAASCERGRRFARGIRDLSPNDREYLMSLFASGAEDRARQEAQSSLAVALGIKKELKKKLGDKSLVKESELVTLKWWSASKCVPLQTHKSE